MPHAIVTRGLDAMRTRFEVVLIGENEARLAALAELALHEVERLESAMSLFRRDSLLSHLNRTAARQPVRVDGEFFGLLRLCQEVWAQSGGLFDPTVAGLMTALGLHEHASLEDVGSLGRGFDALVLDETSLSVRFTRAVALDLGAVAKGFALDVAAGVLREGGVSSALLHGGTSSVLAIGRPPGRDGWDVAIRTPDEGPTRRVTLCDCGLGVSAHHGRVVQGATHVVDPRTGCPAAPAIRVAAVLAPTAALADAWSTATLVRGGRPEGLPGSCECVVF